MGSIRLARRLIAATLATATCGWPAANAEVWGYIDEQGRPHVATSKLDERYQLFFRGQTAADLAAAKQRRDREAELAAFAQTPVFQRLTTHPNAQRFDALIARYAKASELDNALVKAIVAAESGYEPTAVSSKGAVGLMQVIPDTAVRYGLADDRKQTIAEKLFDPATNLRIGTRYLRDLLRLFDDDLELALAAYNAGEGTVQRYENRVPPYPETQDYVKLVSQLYALYKPPAPAAAPGRVTIPRRGQAER